MSKITLQKQRLERLAEVCTKSSQLTYRNQQQMFFQTSYNHAVVKAKLWPVAAKSKASKTTLELYEDTLETMLRTQKGVFAFERMREKLIRRHVEAAAEAEEGSLRKGKHKKATKGRLQAAK